MHAEYRDSGLYDVWRISHSSVLHLKQDICTILLKDWGTLQKYKNQKIGRRDTNVGYCLHPLSSTQPLQWLYRSCKCLYQAWTRIDPSTARHGLEGLRKPTPQCWILSYWQILGEKSHWFHLCTQWWLKPAFQRIVNATDHINGHAMALVKLNRPQSNTKGEGGKWKRKEKD